MDIIVFNKWKGQDGLNNFITNQTGCTVYTGVGINYRKENKTCVLRSADDAYFYDDNLENPKRVEYTLFGQIGDQDEEQKRFNEPLLNPDKTHHIFLYRVTSSPKKYIWYGKYKIVDKYEKLHIDKNYQERTIVMLVLEKSS
jgi:hypothetical protein